MVIVLLCVLTPQHWQQKNSKLIYEKQKKVGKYIVLFTAKDGQEISREDKHEFIIANKDKSTDFKQFADTRFDTKYEMKQTLQKSSITYSTDTISDSAYSNKPFDISNITDLSLQDIKRKSSEEYNYNDEDPVIARGFEEEFVTHRSDGNGFLILESDEFSENVNKSYEILKSKSLYGKDIIKYNKEDVLLHDATIFANINNDEYSSDNKQKADSIDMSKMGKFKFIDYDIKVPQYYVLKNYENTYFTTIDSKICFTRGTDIEKTKVLKGEKCSCNAYFFGSDCGIPEAVKYSSLPFNTKLTRRQIPRRVINGLPVNHEFAMFEARMHELYDAVDVFVIIESNYTSHGDHKELHFLNEFKKGYLAKYQEKIHYIKLQYFSDQSKKSGWMADSYIRFYMGSRALKQLKGLRNDDLFILSDADELPTKDVVTFLKLYDGYPEPVGFALRWNVFNFYWQMPADSTLSNWFTRTKEKLSTVYSAATIGMLQDVLLRNVFYIRKEKAWEHPKLAEMVKKYRDKGHLVSDWVAGKKGHYAGWHCSWCFSPSNIVKKMDSAQANDKPRWGDYPEKKNISYITSRIWKGKWFDDKLQLVSIKNPEERFYAPQYFLQHNQMYRSLLYHPSHPLNLNKPWQPP